MRPRQKADLADAAVTTFMVAAPPTVVLGTGIAAFPWWAWVVTYLVAFWTGSKVGRYVYRRHAHEER
jgi:hypothetical protein